MNKNVKKCPWLDRKPDNIIKKIFSTNQHELKIKIENNRFGFRNLSLTFIETRWMLEWHKLFSTERGATIGYATSS